MMFLENSVRYVNRIFTRRKMDGWKELQSRNFNIVVIQNTEVRMSCNNSHHTTHN